MSETKEQSGASREELVQRLEMVEQVIAEGRQATCRYGWAFVMWGTVYVAAIGWQWLNLPLREWAWAVCVTAAIVIGAVVEGRRKAKGMVGRNVRSRSINAIWESLGVCMILFVATAFASHNANTHAYVAAIMIFLGMAHLASARILRWWLQGVAAAIWLVNGMMSFFVSDVAGIGLFVVSSVFGMILFGLAAMAIERRERARVGESAHA
jgi:hypothetical protein